nr:hypothetical protein CFP56_32469 [Quercus suber]
MHKAFDVAGWKRLKSSSRSSAFDNGLLLHWTRTVLATITVPVGDAYRLVLDVEGYPESLIGSSVILAFFSSRHATPELVRPFRGWISIALCYMAAQVFANGCIIPKTFRWYWRYRNAGLTRHRIGGCVRRDVENHIFWEIVCIRIAGRRRKLPFTTGTRHAWFHAGTYEHGALVAASIDSLRVDDHLGSDHVASLPGKPGRSSSSNLCTITFGYIRNLGRLRKLRWNNLVAPTFACRLLTFQESRGGVGSEPETWGNYALEGNYGSERRSSGRLARTSYLCAQKDKSRPISAVGLSKDRVGRTVIGSEPNQYLKPAIAQTRSESVAPSWPHHGLLQACCLGRMQPSRPRRDMHMILVESTVGGAGPHSDLNRAKDASLGCAGSYGWSR